MKKYKKNDRPSVGAPGRPEESGVCETSNDSIFQSTTLPPTNQRVSDYLLPGQQNAVPLRHLKELLHLDGRKVRLMIRAERLSGVPILADNSTGYYLPDNDCERAQCVRSMRRRAAEIVRAADAIERAERVTD